MLRYIFELMQIEGGIAIRFRAKSKNSLEEGSQDQSSRQEGRLLVSAVVGGYRPLHEPRSRGSVDLSYTTKCHGDPEVLAKHS